MPRKSCSSLTSLDLPLYSGANKVCPIFFAFQQSSDAFEGSFREPCLHIFSPLLLTPHSTSHI